MTLVLPTGADFVASLTRQDGTDWPAGPGIGVQIEVGAATWVATTAGPTVTWDVDEALVAAVIATAPKKARLVYVNGASKVLWATGPAVIR